MSADDWNRVLQALENWKKTDQSQRFGQYLLNNCPEFCGQSDHLIFYAGSVEEVFERLSTMKGK